MRNTPAQEVNPQLDLSLDNLIPLVPSRGYGTTISVAEITGKNPRTVVGWATGRTKRVLKAWKIGGSYYTTREALDAFASQVVVMERKRSRRKEHEVAVASLLARLERNESRGTHRKSDRGKRGPNRKADHNTMASQTP